MGFRRFMFRGVTKRATNGTLPAPPWTCAGCGCWASRRLRGCERIPSRRRAADASRRAALLLLAIASGYDSSSRLAGRAPRPPGSVRGFVHKLSRLSGIVAPTVGAIRRWYALNEAIYCDATLGDARVPERRRPPAEHTPPLLDSSACASGDA